VDRDALPSVEIKHSALVLNVRPGATEEKKREVLERWYREQIRESAPRLIAKWERIIGVRVQDFYVRRMKTKWGSCSESSGTIRLNSELAKKPRECLEYIVVHEMVHLLEHTHNRRFMSLMEQFMPRWQSYRELLNRLPVRREKWIY
jgi:predicted metal-dependent hydrolase